MKRFFPLSLFALALTSCGFFSQAIDPDKITSINLIDRNGMSETINAKERLASFDKADFLAPQPYQKVLRVYGRAKNGTVASTITSYHPNGHVKQYLEAVNNRASGVYREWYPNGKLKVETTIIGGIADLGSQAEQSWLFDGVSRAWDEEGHLIAEIPYTKGELEGQSLYYHPNGALWKQIPYEKNQLHGTLEVFLEEGTLFQTTDYKEGEKSGVAMRYWGKNQIAYREEYVEGRLHKGHYYTETGTLLTTVQEGSGQRAIFGKKAEGLRELHEYKNGLQEGMVQIYGKEGSVVSRYSIKNGEKEGEEILYFPQSQLPRLQMTWRDGLLTGVMRSWYENGQLESQREMRNNQKNGFLTAWYPNGSVLLIEEYENDRLLKGEYYRLGEKSAVSKIERGAGIATLFSQDGSVCQKVRYAEGIPTD